MQANKLISMSRLSLAEDLLVASGWTQDKLTWAPPESLAVIIKKDLQMQEVGTYQLPDAMAIQLKLDDAVCRFT